MTQPDRAFVRSIGIWDSHKPENELLRAARRMMPGGKAAADNLAAVWFQLHDIRRGESSALEGADHAHVLLVGTAPRKIQGRIWRFAVSVVASHSCLLCCSNEYSFSDFMDIAQERDGKWIKLCAKIHPPPLIIQI